MTRAKQAADLHSSTLDQQALHQLLTHYDLDAHIVTIREEYHKRMLRMKLLLSDARFADLRWLEPQGGMFFWVELPASIHSSELLKLAVQEGVAFVPGTDFYAENPKHNTMRLNFTHTAPEHLGSAMDRLSAALTAYRQQV
jgi:2-aminoadipate transaminase